MAVLRRQRLKRPHRPDAPQKLSAPLSYRPRQMRRQQPQRISRQSRQSRQQQRRQTSQPPQISQLRRQNPHKAHQGGNSTATVRPTIPPTRAALADEYKRPASNGDTTPPPPPPPAGGYVCPDGSACIKGNISDNGRLYHFPGCQSYNAQRSTQARANGGSHRRLRPRQRAGRGPQTAHSD